MAVSRLKKPVGEDDAEESDAATGHGEPEPENLAPPNLTGDTGGEHLGREKERRQSHEDAPVGRGHSDGVAEVDEEDAGDEEAPDVAQRPGVDVATHDARELVRTDGALGEVPLIEGEVFAAGVVR